MILVDTSSWIDFFKGKDPFASVIEASLEANQVAICGPVLTELRRGFRSASERDKVLKLIYGCRELIQPDYLWDDAGDIGFALRRGGKTVKTMDLLIATYAIAYRVPILTSDKEFYLIQKVAGSLEIFDGS